MRPMPNLFSSTGSGSHGVTVTLSTVPVHSTPSLWLVTAMPMETVEAIVKVRLPPNWVQVVPSADW